MLKRLPLMSIPTKRKEFLDDAEKLINGDREKEYGDPLKTLKILQQDGPL